MVQDQELVTVREAAARLHLKESTIRGWIRSKQVTTYKSEIGRGFYVDAREIAAKLIPKKQ